ncbi:hypothetical protein CROQUDRAFT_107748 [Cronartium quercuum f. sp. fusiforme G11]|uniref:Secreted protein n=1 Tax=Cronartium quercuum f. sp. fusiforme G11 TaxID=708437 RepID=A0A9P6NKA1_9BASI|nr:hypothetical protein CROQUDRAFT_107748 [Cronartium quercuum f. sp. fusiforme G11]
MDCIGAICLLLATVVDWGPPTSGVTCRDVTRLRHSPGIRCSRPLLADKLPVAGYQRFRSSNAPDGCMVTGCIPIPRDPPLPVISGWYILYPTFAECDDSKEKQ